MDKIIVFLPCRKGSERVKHKNIKDFTDIEGGLIYIKLSQLVAVDEISTIIVSTNDEEVKRVARSFNNRKIVIDDRSEELASSSTSTDDLISYIPSIIDRGTVLWTHVTSPFINATKYRDIIHSYHKALDEGYDSLMTVTHIYGFLWNKSKPINYNRKIEKWPRTQTIEPVNEVNSGVFLSSIENYRKFSDRIGINPYLKPLDKITSFDIDWEEDFLLAECILNSKIGHI